MNDISGLVFLLNQTGHALADAETAIAERDRRIAELESEHDSTRTPAGE